MAGEQITHGATDPVIPGVIEDTGIQPQVEPRMFGAYQPIVPCWIGNQLVPQFGAADPVDGMPVADLSGSSHYREEGPRADGDSTTDFAEVHDGDTSSRAPRRGLRNAAAAIVAVTGVAFVAGCTPESVALQYADTIGDSVGLGHSVGSAIQDGDNVIHIGGDTVHVFKNIARVGEDGIVYTGSILGISVRQLIKEGIDCVYVKGLLQGAYDMANGKKFASLEQANQATLACENTVDPAPPPATSSNPAPPTATPTQAPASGSGLGRIKLVDQAGGHTEFDDPNPDVEWGVEVVNNDPDTLQVLGPNDTESRVIAPGLTIIFDGRRVTILDTLVNSGPDRGEIENAWLELRKEH